MFHILVADDERLERMAVRKTLEEHFPEECEIFEAEHGAKALELLEEMTPHIAILDIKMPGVNGIEVAREIRTRFPGCKMIMLTGYTYFNYAKECISIGVMEFMVKPFRDQDLADHVRRAMTSIQEETHSTSLYKKREIEPNLPSPAEETESTWVTVVEKNLQENFAQNISMEEIASQVGFSAHYFCRMFKQEFSVNFVDYVADLRLKKACILLENPQTSVKEVCFQVGYSEPNYFSRVFKKAYGVTPSQYQKNAILSK